MWTVATLAVLLYAWPGSQARRSPNADQIEAYYVNGPGANLYSSDILEDSLLDVPGLITKYGYPVEIHKVTTEDGYILEMHRIPHGRYQNNFRDPKKPVIFVMHGLTSSSAEWVILGPDRALAYILAEAGYDVWLGNARGNTYSRNHVTLNPDVTREEFWRFSWDEIGTRDLPAMIDHALKTSGKSRLHYIGHSQGTTAFWVMGSIRPEYNDKIISMQAFAPVAFLEFNNNPAFVAVAPHAKSIEAVANLIGYNELVPNSPLFTWLGSTFCSDDALTQPICSNMLFLMMGGGQDMHNATLLPLKLAHAPAGAAVRQIVHYGQHIRKNHFSRYDHGSAMANWRAYRSFSAPSYDLSKVTAPVFFHYAKVDVFAHLDDLEKLWRGLGRPIAKMMVPLDSFSHIDFAWGSGAKELLYDRTINIMKSIGDD